MNNLTKNTLILFGFAILFAVIFSACSSSSGSDPDAQTPTITAISDDIATVLHVPKEISVGVEISDKGTLSFQWFVATTKIAAGEAVSGANGTAFSPSADEVGIFYYYCVITNRLGSSTRRVTSPRVTYTVSEHVNASAPVIALQPANVTADFDEQFSLSVIAYAVDGGTLSYQWYFSATEETEATAIDGATAASYGDTVSADSLGHYYCVITNTISDNGDGGEKSAEVRTNTVIVSNSVVNANTPAITAQPTDMQAVIPAICVFSVGAYAADDGILSYQWYKVADGETDGTQIASETSARLKITTSELGRTGYYCIVTNTIEDNGDGGTKTASAQTETAWFDAVYLKDVVPAPSFTDQPPAMSVAPLGKSIALSCVAESAHGEVSYRWYESADGTASTGTAVIGANSATLATPAFIEKKIRYFYCVATTVLSADDGEDIKSAAAISDVVSVAYTGLPVVSVETPDHVAITSKTVWTKNATISVTGASDESWNFDEVTTSIRGRGNSTWGQPKKPYALKLDKKQKIFGLPKHKRWVLIANYLDNSFMRNEMAFYLSEQFGLDWTVHGEFVDLVLNGEYKGLYWLGEAIKVDENRVNINDGEKTMADDEDKDYLIEMDVYFDEVVKFKSSIRGMPYMIKNDDYMIDDSDTITSGGKARLTRLQEKITALEEKLYPAGNAAPDESYSEVLDIDSWAKFWFVNEIMDNGELGHPKSCYFTFDSAKNIFKVGPVWDFDWASLYQRSSCGLKNTIYYNALFKSPSFAERTKELWAESYAKIDIGTQIEAMREQLALAAEYDTMRWGAHNDPSGIVRANFDAYVDFLKDTLQKKLAVVNADVSGL